MLTTRLKIKEFSIFRQYPDLLHGYSTRFGGHSVGAYKGLNTGLTSGDNITHVKANRELLFDYFGLKSDQLAIPSQVHSHIVKIVDKPGIYQDCDALISDKPNLYLTIQTADCFPVYLYEPTKNVVALVHSGWKGTAGNIIGRTIELMKAEYKISPAKLTAAIGAGVQQSCYQVDDKTAAHFDEKYLHPDGPGHYKLDVQAAILDQLKNSGLIEDNIEFDKVCTHCSKGEYFSYRRDGNRSGRMLGIIGINKKID